MRRLFLSNWKADFSHYSAIYIHSITLVIRVHPPTGPHSFSFFLNVCAVRWRQTTEHIFLLKSMRNKQFKKRLNSIWWSHKSSTHCSPSLSKEESGYVGVSSYTIGLLCSASVASPSQWLLNPDCSVRAPKSLGAPSWNEVSKHRGEPCQELRGTSPSSCSFSSWQESTSEADRNPPPLKTTRHSSVCGEGEEGVGI